MRNILIFSLCINLFSFCSSKQKETDDCQYYKLITSDFGTSSHFVSAEVKGPDSLFTVVITNFDLYRMLFFNKKVKEQEYSQYLIDHWRKGEPIKVDTLGQRNLRYLEIKKDTALEKLLRLNKDQIIARYFDKGILKSEKANFAREKNLIYCLIKAGVPCRRDDLSGYVVVQDTVVSTNCK